MKLRNDFDFELGKKILEFKLEMIKGSEDVIEATEKHLKMQRADYQILKEQLHEYELENGEGDHLADEARDKEIQEMI